jgi:hypothetical protein
VDTTAADIRDRLTKLEAERMILATELRNALTRAAVELLPLAVRQAQPTPKRGKRAAKQGSPALLRLISRIALRPLHLERPK